MARDNPPPKSSYMNFKGMTVPNGKPNLSGGYFNLNEYVIYNINQARIRYVLWMNLNGNG